MTKAIVAHPTAESDLQHPLIQQAGRVAPGEFFLCVVELRGEPVVPQTLIAESGTLKLVAVDQQHMLADHIRHDRKLIVVGHGERDDLPDSLFATEDPDGDHPLLEHLIFRRDPPAFGRLHDRLAACKIDDLAVPFLVVLDRELLPVVVAFRHQDLIQVLLRRRYHPETIFHLSSLSSSCKMRVAYHLSCFLPHARA